MKKKREYKTSHESPLSDWLNCLVSLIYSGKLKMSDEKTSGRNFIKMV